MYCSVYFDSLKKIQYIFSSSILDSSGLNTNALINVIDRLLERDQSLVKMIDETREDVQRSEIEVKKYLQKSEMLENENELKDRKIGQSLQRDGFLFLFLDHKKINYM